MAEAPLKEIVESPLVDGLGRDALRLLVGIGACRSSATSRDAGALAACSGTCTPSTEEMQDVLHTLAEARVAANVGATVVLVVRPADRGATTDGRWRTRRYRLRRCSCWVVEITAVRRRGRGRRLLSKDGCDSAVAFREHVLSSAVENRGGESLRRFTVSQFTLTLHRPAPPLSFATSVFMPLAVAGSLNPSQRNVWNVTSQLFRKRPPFVHDLSSRLPARFTPVLSRDPAYICPAWRAAFTLHYCLVPPHHFS